MHLSAAGAAEANQARCQQHDRHASSGFYAIIPPNGSICENMTSSIKPELYNILHNRQSYRNTEPWLQLRCTENSLRFGHVVFEIATDRQTHRHANRNIPHPYRGKVIRQLFQCGSDLPQEWERQAIHHRL